jgi:hypothetical protein
LSPVCTKAGDTLTFYNAVSGGVWISAGPIGPIGSAYWGFGLAVLSIDAYAGDLTFNVNGHVNGQGGAVGETMRATLAVWDWDTYSATLFYDGVQATNSESNTNVRYPTKVGLTLFGSPDKSDEVQNAVFEEMVLFDKIEVASSRQTMATWLKDQFSLASLLGDYTTADGFTLKSELLTPYPSHADAYGNRGVKDANGIAWNPQSGGYRGSNGPSLGYATNINNGATMWRSVVEPGDSDVTITGAERAEVSAANAAIKPGQKASVGFQFQFESGAQKQTGDWCTIGQFHYDNNDNNNIPDITNITCNSGVLTIDASGKACGSPVTLTPGKTYAVEEEITWSSSHTADSLKFFLGANGANLTLQCDMSGRLFATDTGAYLKAGIYRGYPWSNAGALVLRTMNTCFSNTANACAKFQSAATQPALPKHP